MISNRTIREWFRNKINDSSDFDMSLFAWENRQFDSTNDDIYYQERLSVNAESPSTNEESVKSGIMFYDVITNKGSGTELSEDNAEALASIFDPENNKDVQIQSGLKIDIDEATTSSRSDFDDNRSQLPVRLEFRAYEVS